MSNESYEMILCVVNAGFSDEVMDAAREAGARGGTVIHARGTANKEAEAFFHITIQPDKDLVMLLVPASIKDGAVTLTCSNLSDVDEEEVLIQVNGLKPADVTISLLAGECHAMNTFENKENVTIKPCTDFTVTDAGISLKLPACSVAAITVRG